MRRICKPGSIGRGEKVRTAVHAATISELAEVGCAALTIESVAQRAGVHKTTVYRRWKDREALVVDAIADHVQASVPVPDTGAIDGDMRELARGLVAWLQSPVGDALVMTMVAAEGLDPEIVQTRKEFYKIRFKQAGIVVDRAIARGELPAGTDATEVLKTLVAPIFFRHVVHPEPIGDAVADQAARVALTAAQAGILCRTTPAPSDQCC
jgi:AcrR family transcriptional regulator